MPTVIDNFTPYWWHIRAFADAAVFADTLNPVDGKLYPETCAPLPRLVRAAIARKLRDHVGKVSIPYMFLRRYPAGVNGLSYPHIDWPMGEGTLVLYLNRAKHCQGGTAFRRGDVVEMRPNRAVIFDAKAVHWSTPADGFGTTNFDARLVLVAFFNRDDHAAIHQGIT
jgi:hypothetical protein